MRVRRQGLQCIVAASVSVRHCVGNSGDRFLCNVVISVLNSVTTRGSGKVSKGTPNLSEGLESVLIKRWIFILLAGIIESLQGKLAADVSIRWCPSFVVCLAGDI